MITLKVILLIVFVVLMIRIFINVGGIIRKHNAKIKVIGYTKKKNEVILSEISSEVSAHKVAERFLILMRNSYVFIHTMINEGNKYIDKNQTKSFCSSLDQNLLMRLNALEGKYE